MGRRLRGYLPPLLWVRSYNRQVFTGDLSAALIVAVMVIPQSLAFALVAGLPAQAGLYASILPVMAYALFGSSNALAIGPVALISLMSAAAVGQVAAAGTAGYMVASIALALLAGLILLVMGLLRLGFLSNFISHPVISGFITASGLLIAASQFRHIAGVEVHGDNLPALAQGYWQTLPDSNLPTLVIGLLSLLFLYCVRYQLPKLLARLGLSPKLAATLVRSGPLIAVAAATLAVALLALDQQGVAVVGEVPAGLPPFGLPGGSLALMEALALPALLISIVIFVESVSLAHKLATSRNERVDPDQELIGLGAANIASALSGGFAVAGGFSRSAINYDAGARTPAAGALTGLVIGLITLFCTGVFYYLPDAVLAATVTISVLSLVDLPGIARVWSYSRHDGAALLGTLAITLLSGVTLGILTGVSLSLILYLWRTSRPHSALVGRIEGTEHFRNSQRYHTETDPHIRILRVDESLYFANARYLEDCVYAVIADNPELRDFVLMCPAVNWIDTSALESLEAINHRLSQSGIRLHLCEVKGPVMDKLRRSRFIANLTGKVFMSTFQAWCELRGNPEVAPSASDPSPNGPGQ